MSRWDALKPASGDETKSRRLHAIKRKPRDATGRCARDDEKNVVKNASEKSEQFETLFHACQRQLETENVTSLANEMIKGNASVVSQAFHAVKVVDEVFLPYLEKLHEQERLSLSQEEERGLSASVQAIHTLLDNCSHYSSIMAPLVSEIQSDGNEIQISNPTRIRLFRDLQCILLEPADRLTPIVLERVAQSLVMALKVATRIEGTAKHAKSKNYDMDPSAVYKFFIYSRSRSLLYTDPDLLLSTSSLELMKALLKRHPNTSCSFTTLLLIGDHTSTEQNAMKSCSVCGNGQCGARISTFLDMLHEPGRKQDCSREVCLAVDVVKAVLENAPLSSWIQQQQEGGKLRQQSDRRGQLVTTTASGFRERLSQGLENLIRITKCRIITGDCNIDNYAMIQFLILAGCIFCRMPINGGSSAELHKACSELVQTTANLCIHSSPQVQQAAIKALLEGMGGSVSPQGELTSMSFPIKAWLSSCRKGGAFATEMTHSLLQTVRARKQNKEMHAQLVRAMLRTFPDLFLKNKDRWDALVEYMLTCSESTNAPTRQEGALAIQSLMKGRKDFGSCVVDSRPMDSVMPILRTMLKSSDGPSTRCAVLSAYGSLLPQDWYLLATIRPRMDHAHINPLLGIAQDSHTSNKVQSEACKAIGDVCTNYFSTTGKPMDNLGYDTKSKELCRTILDTLLTLIEPNNCEVSIRASAIFAIGNLAHALRDASIPLQCPETVSLLPARLLAEMANDRDAKITGNAIRALGHVTCLLSREDYNVTLYSLDFDPKWLLRSSIQALTSRLRSAILLAGGELPNLNWKQRSAIKKHGWGACNSLASIFCAGVVSSRATNDRDEVEIEDDDHDDDILRDCLSTLLQCVEESHKVHEKVVISSMIALRSLDSSTLSHHCGRQHLSLAKALVVCFSRVCTEQDHDSLEDDQDKRLSSTKFIAESALLLAHLLESCSIADAADAIRSQTVNKSLLDYLYQWMVENDCPTRVFDTFALAMQKPHVQVDVQTEQRFASRAMSLLSPHDQEADEL